MYALGTLHPDLKEAREPNYKGGFFTRQEKEDFIRKFYREKRNIPLCVDHCGAQGFGFVVPEKERIGRVVDLFNNAKGEMIVKIQLDPNHAAYSRINRGIHVHEENWGLSVWIDSATITNDKESKTLKNLTHVALTTDPYFASHGTFLHDWNILEPSLDRFIADTYFYEGSQAFLAPEMRQKLDRMTLFDSSLY